MTSQPTPDPAPAPASEPGSEAVQARPAKAGHRKGPSRASQEPERRCLLSGEVKPRAALLRFVEGPDGSVVPDLDAKLPGRGLWLSARRDMVETATARRAFSRAARRQLVAPPDLAERVEWLLRARCLDLLGLARRAGLVAAGFQQARTAARSGQVALLLEAADGGEDGRRKVTGLAPGVPVADLFSGAELGAALGRAHAVHVAVSRRTAAGTGGGGGAAKGGDALVERLLAALARLEAYRAVPADAASGLAPGGGRRGTGRTEHARPPAPRAGEHLRPEREDARPARADARPEREDA